MRAAYDERMAPPRIVTACLLLSAACGDTGAAGEDESGSSSATAATGEAATGEAPTTGAPVDPFAITYYEHVRPILAAHCVACHTAGGIGPLALDSYEAAAPFAGLIAAVTESRQMPPYPADASGACGEFRDARWLADDELTTLADWAAQGALAGDASIAPPEVPPLPRLTGDVRTAAMPGPYVPSASMPDDYRCFVVDSPAVGDSFITGFDVCPGDARIVHHVVVFTPNTPEAATAAEALDAAEAGPGYTCFGASGVDAEVAAAWAPGGGATRFPAGTGVALRPGKLILQLHYNTAAAQGVPDQTAVDLEIVTDGVEQLRFVGLVDQDLSLPPGLPEAEAGFTTPTTDDVATVRIHGVFPHMHTIGRTLRMVAHEPGGDRCMLDVPRWDFHWQLFYFYEQPFELDPSYPATLRCTYDTTGREQTTVFGEGTMDEMCVLGLWVTDV